MWAIELVKGKAQPPSKPKEFSEKGKTILLFLHLNKNIHGQGFAIVMDTSIFCVLSVLIVLQQFGVFASTFIKKWKYWPKFVPGDVIKEKMKT